MTFVCGLVVGEASVGREDVSTKTICCQRCVSVFELTRLDISGEFFRVVLISLSCDSISKNTSTSQIFGR